MPVASPASVSLSRTSPSSGADHERRAWSRFAKASARAARRSRQDSAAASALGRDNA